MNGQRVPMSQDTYNKLKVQLDQIKKVERPAIIEEISQARSQGDLAENAEYHAAKEKQAQIEGNIQIIEDKLARAEIITKSASDSDHIIFGATVSVKNLKTQKEINYTLVGPDGLNLMENKISAHSPIGKGLMSKKIGDVVEIQTPKGLVQLEILNFC